MNISDPFAPNSTPINPGALDAFSKVWSSGHPDTPWSHQMKITGVLKHMSQYLNEVFLGLAVDANTHTFKVFGGGAYDMYMRLYSLYVDAFIVRGKRQYMPRIVVFSDVDPRAMQALRYLETAGRVRVAVYYRMPFEPIDRERLRSLIVMNTVLVSASYVNAYGRRLTETAELDALTRDCGKTPLHVDITLSTIPSSAATPDLVAPIVSCDMSYRAFPHTYVIGMHTEHILNQASNQMHAFLDLPDNHCAAVATFVQMKTIADAAAVDADADAPVADNGFADFLTDLRLRAPTAYITTIESVHKSGWPQSQSGIIVIAPITDGVLSFVVRVGVNIVNARKLQKSLLANSVYMHVVDASDQIRSRDDPDGEMQKIMANVCVVSRRSTLLLDSLASLLCDSSRALSLCG